jgi:hypothetical protein
MVMHNCPGLAKAGLAKASTTFFNRLISRCRASLPIGGAGFFAALLLANMAGAQSGAITYIDASVANTVMAGSNDAGNGTAPVAGSTLAPPNPSGTGAGNDNAWWNRTGFGVNSSASGGLPPTGTVTLAPTNNIFEVSGNGGGENAPRLATTVSGLQPRQYAVFAYFWDVRGGGDWGVRASLVDGTDPLPYFGSGLAGELATTVVPTEIATDGGSRWLYQAQIGITAPNATSITVFIDDRPAVAGVGNGQRTWYDGIGYRVYFPPGDANFDGSVNRTDYNLIRDNLAKTVIPGTMGDLDGNGRVSLTDFHLWKSAPQTPATPSADVVPEPGAATLAVLGAMAVARLARRRSPSRTRAKLCSFVALAAGVAAGTSAQAQITYIDVTPTNTLQAPNPTGPVGAGVPWAGTTGPTGVADGQWVYRTGQGLPATTTVPPTGAITFDPTNGSLMEVSGPPGLEDAPRLATSVTGLPNDTYDVYVFFWVSGADYNLRAGLTDTAGPLPVFGSTSGVQIANTTTVQLRRVLIGQITGTSFTVFAEDRPATVANNDRTWYDGIGYALGLLPGDVNGDDLIDAVDYGLIKSNYRMTNATRGQGDLTGDGVVNLDDYTQWRNQVAPLEAAGGSVPEPTSAALAMAGLLALTARRVRRGSRRVA